ncbi:hypothetical protein FOA52_002563 [Chlamydomonas sp. UWO 241]|nr:hypothetical protein FOA52_002563 [Chlamydomonas sp. UWO 241]
MILLLVWGLLATSQASGIHEPERPTHSWTSPFLDDLFFRRISGNLVGDPGAAVTANPTLQVSFNLQGLERIASSHPELADAVRVLRRLRVPGANAFVVSVQATPPQSASSGAERDGRNGRAPPRAGLFGSGAEADDRLAVTKAAPSAPRAQLVPYQMSVLYLQVPSDIVGGAFVAQGLPPEASPVRVQPSENGLLTFRGDLAHHVEPFFAASGRAVVALVIEFYVVPEARYSEVRPWGCRAGCGDDGTKRRVGKVLR